MARIEKLLEIASKGKGLINSKGVLASGDGFFKRFFARDTYITLLSLTQTAKKWRAFYISPSTLKKAAAGGLTNMNYQGWLAHEAGTKEQGFPFPINKKTGQGHHFGSVDGNGWAILTLCELYSLFPKDQKLFDSTWHQLLALTRWSIYNARKNDGFIGHLYKETKKYNGSREGTWQDGNLAILNDSGKLPVHPIKYVLEQGLYALALRKASDALRKSSPILSKKAFNTANVMREKFNKFFIYNDKTSGVGVARAIEGNGNLIHSKNIDELISIGFVYQNDSIVSEENQHLVMPILRNLIKELSTPYGALRTQSLTSHETAGYGYHGKNSIWPVANGLAVKSLENLRKVSFIQKNKKWAKELHEYAIDVAVGTAKIIIKTQSPVETLQIDPKGNLTPYTEIRPDKSIFTSSKIQAWSVGELVWLYYFLKENKINKIPKLP